MTQENQNRNGSLFELSNVILPVYPRRNERFLMKKWMEHSGSREVFALLCNLRVKSRTKASWPKYVHIECSYNVLINFSAHQTVSINNNLKLEHNHSYSDKIVVKEYPKVPKAKIFFNMATIPTGFIGFILGTKRGTFSWNNFISPFLVS